MNPFAVAVAQWRVLRAEFQIHLEDLYQRAEVATNGNLLNARAHARGINAFSLMYGPRSRVDAYASEELKEFFDAHGRMTFAEYEQNMTDIEGMSA